MLANITNLLFKICDHLLTIAALIMNTIAEIANIYPEKDSDIFRISSKYSEYVGI